MRFIPLSLALVLLLSFLQAAQAREPAGSSAAAQDTAVVKLKAELDSLKTEMQNRVRQLSGKVEELEQQKKEEELEKLLREAERQGQKEKEEGISISRKFRGGERQLAELNPNISATGDMLGMISSSNDPSITHPGDFTDGSDRFILRAVDINFVAPLDPYTRGKFFFGVDHEGNFSVDEAYLEWLNLPANLNLKIGKFHAQFGDLNRWHTHALPQVDRPLPLVNLFSTTELGGMGLSGNILLPSIFAQVNELTLEVFNGGNGVSFADGGSKNLVYVAHLKNYYDLNRDTYLELGLSGITGKNDSKGDYRTVIGGLSFTLKWAPVDRIIYRTIEFRNEFYLSRREQPGGNMNSFGFFSSLTGKLGPRYTLGERIDYSELPWNNKLSEWSFSPHLDCWQSEWVMLRFQYRFTHRSYLENDSCFLFQCCWAMGPHKHEAY